MAGLKHNLRKLILVVGMIIVVFVGYVEVINLNSKSMTYRQKVLKAVYPAWKFWNKITGKSKTHFKMAKSVPTVSFYSLKATLNDGTEMNMAELKGKKVLIVNTASSCGFTPQYKELQELYEENSGKLMVLGFPTNDFREQEKGTDEEISAFCKLNYGVTFPLVKKGSVVNGENQHPVFKWLTDATQNGWNNAKPKWNFSKYLVNEEGLLVDYFGPAVDPKSKEIMEALSK